MQDVFRCDTISPVENKSRVGFSALSVIWTGSCHTNEKLAVSRSCGARSASRCEIRKGGLPFGGSIYDRQY